MHSWASLNQASVLSLHVVSDTCLSHHLPASPYFHWSSALQVACDVQGGNTFQPLQTNRRVPLETGTLSGKPLPNRCTVHITSFWGILRPNARAACNGSTRLSTCRPDPHLRGPCLQRPLHHRRSTCKLRPACRDTEMQRP